MLFRLVIILSAFFLTGNVRSQIDFKDKFKEATDLMHKGNYPKAAEIWFKLEKLNPDNTNIKFSIGMCYLNSRFEKEKAIPYFIDAEKKMTDDYKIGNYKEEEAPIEAILYLGKTYHIIYQFDEAIQKYTIYKEILSKRNKKDQKKVSHDMNATDNAVSLVNNPVEITIEGIERQINMAMNAKSMVGDSVKVTFNHLTNINTEFAEYRPVLNADETMMIFTARKPDSKGGRKDEQGMYYEDVYVSYNENGVWMKPVSMGDPINTRSHEATVYLNPAGNKLYLYKDVGDELGGGIYESTVEGKEWTRPTLITGSVNTPAWETHASLSADERMMAFTSDREDGLGGKDIWVVKKLPTGEWSESSNIGEVINTEYDEESPYLHPDGKTLYFSSQGHTSMGGLDVFYSELGTDGKWSKPENMGYPVNTTGDDVFFMPTVSGKKAYFSSYRREGKGHLDIYSMDLNYLKEKSLTIYKGLAQDINGKVVKNLIITVFDDETDDLFGIYTPNPITGKFLFILRPGHSYEIEYEVDGVIQSETITVADGGGTEQVGRLMIKEKDKIAIKAVNVSDIDIQEIARIKEASNLEVIEVNVILNTAIEDSTIEHQVKDSVAEQVQVEVNKVLDAGGDIVLENVLFEFNSSVLTKAAKSKIDYIYNYMNDNNKSIKIKISGHTDGVGPEDYNEWLSEKRSKSVRNYLNSKGVDKKRIQYKGFGESNPIAPNKINGEDNPEGRAKNRRVEFAVVE